MTSHFDSVVRVSIVLGLALAAMPLLRRASASARRLVLSVAFASALVAPFLPAWRVGAPAYRALAGRLVVEPVVARAAAVAATHAAARSVDVLALVWLAGALVVAARLALGVARVRALVSRSAAGWAPSVRTSPEIAAPFVTGVLAPVVVVPASSTDWTDERKRAVLLHEIAHVAARDLAVQRLASIVCILHWFNPLAWLAARRLRLERELAADDAVLRAGVRPSSYAAHLLAVAGAAPVATVGLGEPPLARRVAAIVAERRPPALGKKSAVALALATAATALVAACTTSDGRPATARAIDGDLQAYVSGELARATTEWKASGGTILVLAPNGDVLAEAGTPDRPYVTGSTLKAFLLAAAIDEGVVSERDVFDTTSGARGGHVLEDASPGGKLALSEVIATSSNIGFAQIFDRVGGARLDRALRAFGFAPPAELASATAGDWDGALTAIGATMTATPREVARGYAVLADGGDGIVRSRTASRVATLLEAVVDAPNGTGTRARLAVPVAGKTGTSEWTASSGAATYASFVGWAPADHPRVVVFVGVESPHGDAPWGGQVAAPIFARVAARALAYRR